MKGILKAPNQAGSQGQEQLLEGAVWPWGGRLLGCNWGRLGSVGRLLEGDPNLKAGSITWDKCLNTVCSQRALYGRTLFGRHRTITSEFLSLRRWKALSFFKKKAVVPTL